MKTNIRVTIDKVEISFIGSMYVEDAEVVKGLALEQIDKGYNKFVVDLSEVDYIDSTGLGVLVAIHKRLINSGGGITLKGLHGTVEELFSLTRLDKVFEVM